MSTDARIVALTNRDLKEQLRCADLRNSLDSGFHVIGMELSPLRERAGDVLPLAEYFRELLSWELERSVRCFSQSVQRRLRAN